MDVVKVELDVPKDAKEVVDALAAIAEHFKAGKSIAEAAALFPVVMAAVDGSQNVMGGLSPGHRDDLAAYLVKKIFGVLESPAPVPVKAA